jgi:hypothetical protein
MEVAMYRVEITYGHRRPNGELLPAHELNAVEQQILEAFSQAFEGGQAYYRTGGYLDAAGQLTIEPCTVVMSFAEPIDRHIAELWKLASAIASRLEQECVLLTITPVNGLVLMAEPA